MKTLGLYLLVSVLLGLIPATIAQRKGWPFLTWWVYGALLIVIAFPHSLLVKPNPERRNP